jgi:iron complex outermembrane receptor protein
MRKTLVAGLMAGLPAFAPAHEIPLQALPVDVTALPFIGHDELRAAQPVSVLSGQRLDAVRQLGLGDALSDLPGVQSSAFGPGASRPVIRGLDAGRVRVLDGGLDALDVSTFSPDHAVTTNSVFADQVEVIRGPASVLYGGAAIGGVVNVVSSRLPREAMEGLHGRLVSRFDSASRGWLGGVQVDGGAGHLAWNLQASSQRLGDLRVPGAVFSDALLAAEPNNARFRNRVPGSSSDTDEASAGVALTGDKGYLGLAVSRTERNYGVPTLHLAEESPVRIDLQRDRYETAGEWRPGGAVERIRVSAAHIDYGHEELESVGGAREVATRFASRGGEARLELTLAEVSGWRTALGASANRREVSTRGEEALLQDSGLVASLGRGLFAVAERDVGRLHVELGGRIDRESRDPVNGRSRDFTPTTVSAAAQFSVVPGYGAALSLSRSQRAPGIEELYSRGAHHATGTFDVGNVDLGLETARNVELGLRKTEGPLRWKAAVYRTRFNGFVYGALGGAVDGTGMPEVSGPFTLQTIRQDDATFRGVELEGSLRLDDQWTVGLFADRTIASIDNYGPAPRIPPLRIGGTLLWERAGWRADTRLTLADRVDRLAVNETLTDGYLRWDVGASYRTKLARRPAQFLLRGINLLDQDIRLHTSYLKDGYPLAGRSVVLGLTLDF